MNTELVCICCPMGCRITVEHDGDNIVSVTGNTCPRGHNYAVSELTSPVRMVTSFVKASDGTCIPVKTAEAIPKSKIFECMEAIKATEVDLPVHVGDIVVANVASTGINVVATRSFES